MAAGKLKFVKRGGAPVATIPSTDLAAHEDGNSVPNPLDTSREQDLELPLELSVLYINPDADYQQGIQTSKRQTSSGVSTSTVSLPIVFNDTKAKQVADTLHYLSWIERSSYKLVLSRKWVRLEPTDVIVVQYKNTNISMRIVSKDESVVGVVSFDCVAEDTSVYTQSGLGASTSPSSSQIIKVPVQTVLFILDLPALRYEDSTPGIYLAAAGVRSGWDGCSVFKSSDDVTYTEILSITEPAIVGTALTTLGTFTGGNIVDELNTFDVRLINGTLSSITELEMFNEGNAALLGNELIHFKRAELVAANTYRISGILRGRRGTEGYISTHSIGERFILINTLTWYRLPLQLTELGISNYLKAVTFRTSIDRAITYPYTPTGESLKCLSPVLAGAGRTTGNATLISFVRRDRLDSSWRDYVDTQMSETAETYEIDIYDINFSTVLRTLTTNTTSVTYSEANQIMDFGAAQNRLNVKIYQTNTTYGRGTPYVGTLNLGRKNYFSTRWRILIEDLQGVESYLFPSVHEITMSASIGGDDQCNSGTATGSANSADAYKAFDNNDSTYWNGAAYSLPQWIEYQFPTSVEVAQFTVRCTNASLSVKDLALQYYDGATWQSTYVEKNIYWSGSQTKTFIV